MPCCCSGGRYGSWAPAKSPCGICDPPPPRDLCCSSLPSPCNRFAGSFLVDILAAVIFFFFWMMQFWLNAANCVYRLILCLINADRPIQLVVGTIVILILGSMVLSGAFHGSPCGRCRASRVKLSSCAYPTTCSHRATSSCSRASATQINQQQQKQQQQKQQQQKQQEQQQQQRKKESNSSSSSGTSAKSSSSTFKIQCKDSKTACAGPIDKTFYLTITDERKKKLYEASAKFSLLSKDHKPKLVVSTDPIVIENY